MTNNFYNGKDPTDISELAALNDDISDDMIEQLSQQLSGNIVNVKNPQTTTVDRNNDATLFEETQTTNQKTTGTNETTQETNKDSSAYLPDNYEELIVPESERAKYGPQNQTSASSNNINFDDDFARKYKEKLNRKNNPNYKPEQDAAQAQAPATVPASTPAPSSTPTPNPAPTSAIKSKEPSGPPEEERIENLSKGNISEHPLTQDIKDYNDSLDFLDGNVKYSKYVIYIDPQNVNFIEGLTVKERKNLINEILRQQDDIAITKRRFKVLQTLIRHLIVTILTLAVSIPIVYYAINASLEATIDNHRRSQGNWQTLYKDHGKITHN